MRWVLPNSALARAQTAGRSRVSPPAATPFHPAHFPAGHGPTDYARWWTAEAPYAVAYADGYEPYVIASRAWLPPYDEAYVGYGMNKVAHLHAVAAARATFVVSPQHFVAAHEHQRSDAWRATFGADADPRHRMRVAALYRRLKLASTTMLESTHGAVGTSTAAAHGRGTARRPRDEDAAAPSVRQGVCSPSPAGELEAVSLTCQS